jgi:hypothetical protein
VDLVRSGPDQRAPVTAGVGTVPRLFAGLVDDAGLFPPERLAMPAAAARHRRDAAVGHPVLTHRFLCPASRLGELRAQLAPGEPWRLGLVVDTGIDGLPAALGEVADDPRLHLETIELPLPSGPDPAAAADRVTADSGQSRDGAAVYVELTPSVPGWEAALPELASRGLGAKVRCGGLEAHLFPSVEQLAEFVTAAVAAGVPFKATAGLHHAVRYRDPVTGFDHHGFLNLIVAVCRAIDGAGELNVRAALQEDNGDALAGAARAVPEATAALARSLFVAYGSCSTADPLTDLAAFGLVHREPP